MELKDHRTETNLIRRRILVASVVGVLLLGALVTRLTWVQIGQYQHYATLSQDNRIRVVPVPPVRGQIFDRDGVLLAGNEPVFTLDVVPDRVKDMDSLVTEVGKLVRLSDRDLGVFREALKGRPGFEARSLKANLSEEDVARFAVNQHRFQGINIGARLQRRYPLGADLVHVLGYVGRISEADLAKVDKAAYRGTDYIGKLGIEAQYENLLLGKPGVEHVETNAHGRVVRSVARVEPVPGENLHLSLDVKLQGYARQALGEYEGAVVAVEPATGQVLAFASNPVYDPNPFVNGIDPRSYSALQKDKAKPLLNRALNGRYAPGSTIKPAMALAGLQYGRNPGQTTFCPGYYTLKGSSHQYRCWKHEGHGTLAMHDSIVRSCDVFYYTLANQLGIDEMHDFMTQLGYGGITGIDMPGEPSGLFPSTGWKRRARGQVWWPGETVIHGIGQGYTLATPVQLAAITSTIANRGKRMRLRVAAAHENPATGMREPIAPELLDPVQLRDERWWDFVQRAMTDVVHGEGGTARRSGTGAPYRFAGKTGTSQVAAMAQGERYDEKNTPKELRDHSLFIAYAPVEEPKIAVAVIAEHGGGGSRTAAPIARHVMDMYLLGQVLDIPPPSGAH